MPKDYFKKLFKKLFSSRGTDAVKAEPTPFRDWKIVVSSFFVGFAISLAINIYMMLQINSEDSLSVAAQKSDVLGLNREGLAKVLAGLATKEAFPAQSATTTIPVVDPSR